MQRVHLAATIIACVFAAPPHLTQAQPSFFDDFEDNNLTDDSPIAWFGSDIDSGAVTAVDGNMALAPAPGDDFTNPFAEVSHTDARIDVVYEAPADRGIFLFAVLRDTRNGEGDGYWGGLFATGELVIGYITPTSNPIVERNVLLPSGAVAAGEDVTIQLQAVGNEISLRAWETQLGPASAATLHWTDPLDRYPTGNLVFPIINRNGSSETVLARSFRFTQIPEPGSAILVCFGVVASSILRSRRP